MKTICRTTDGETAFIIAKIPPAYHELVRHLAYAPSISKLRTTERRGLHERAALIRQALA